MDNIKNIITGSVITLVIGGTAYTVSQKDIANNLAEDTGLTQEQAEQYINDIPEEELASWSEIGNDFITESKDTLAWADETDCVEYEYEWESPTVTCSAAKAHLYRVGKMEETLGQAYIQLDSENATEDDMRTIISHLDQMNADYDTEISRTLFGDEYVDEMVMTNAYNKSVLKAALESA